jgi:hypothetical protein
VRRYTEPALRRAAAEAGLEVKRIVRFNRVSSLPWWVSGKLLRRRNFSLFQMKMVNLLTPVMRLVDSWLPLPPMSLIAVMERRTRAPAGPATVDMALEREGAPPRPPA